MKIVGIITFITLSTTLNAQEDVTGRYLDYYNKRIELRADSTFNYTDKPSWWEGTWKMNKDTVFLIAKSESNRTNKFPNPEKVIYRKGRLYLIKNGKLDTKKRTIQTYRPPNDSRPIYPKIPSWFVKSND
jgi:hypothetical protein